MPNIAMKAPWKKLGSGSYNTAYLSADGQWVLKIQHDNTNQTDRPSRSVRLWNMINPNLPQASCYAEPQYGEGWLCPFVKGRQSTDEEMQQAVIRIFNDTGRILADATAPKNFVTTEAGEVVCVDIGLALQLEDKEEQVDEDAHFFASSRIRKPSLVSLKAWADTKDAFGPFFKASAVTYPNTVDTIKALLFIKNHRPDIFNTDFLIAQDNSRKKLSQAYDGVNVKAAQGLLKIGRPITPDNIKESCIKLLERYINSRGSIKLEGQFKPSFITKWFREEKLTATKVQAAQDLMLEIKNSHNFEEIKSKLVDFSGRDELSVSGTLRRSGLLGSLNKCIKVAEDADSALRAGIKHCK